MACHRRICLSHTWQEPKRTRKYLHLPHLPRFHACWFQGVRGLADELPVASSTSSAFGHQFTRSRQDASRLEQARTSVWTISAMIYSRDRCCSQFRLGCRSCTEQYLSAIHMTKLVALNSVRRDQKLKEISMQTVVSSSPKSQ